MILLWSKEIKISWLGSFYALSNQTATVVCTNNCDQIKKLMTKLANQTLCQKCRSFFGSKYEYVRIRKNSVFGHFSQSETFIYFFFISLELTFLETVFYLYPTNILAYWEILNQLRGTRDCRLTLLKYSKLSENAFKFDKIFGTSTCFNVCKFVKMLLNLLNCFYFYQIYEMLALYNFIEFIVILLKFL